MSFNPISAIANGVLGAIGNVPILGSVLKPLTDALSGLFGGPQGAGNIQSIMNDYDNGTANADQLFNAVNNGLDGSAASDNGGPADQLKSFMASSPSGQPVDGDRLMQLLKGLRGGPVNAGGNIAQVGNTTGEQTAISF